MTDSNRSEATDEEIETIKKWLKEQPHLPNEINENMLRMFMHTWHYDIQEIQKILTLYYKLRGKSPEIFTNRDPFKSEIQDSHNSVYVCPLPTPTREGCEIIVYKFRDTNPESFNPDALVKYLMALADVRLATETKQLTGSVLIYDMNGFSLRHLSRQAFTAMKKISIYLQETYPIRMKQAHVINTAPYIKIVNNFCKIFIYAEAASMFHFHTPGSDTLYKYVPKELLPKDYGGNSDTLENIHKDMLEQMITNRDYLKSERFWNVNTHKNVSEDVGNFKFLSID